jgi:hypothetical protein
LDPVLLAFSFVGDVAATAGPLPAGAGAGGGESKRTDRGAGGGSSSDVSAADAAARQLELLQHIRQRPERARALMLLSPVSKLRR